MRDRLTPVSVVVESGTIEDGEASAYRHSSPVLTITAAGKIAARTLLAIHACAEIARIHLKRQTDTKATQ